MHEPTPELIPVPPNVVEQLDQALDRAIDKLLELRQALIELSQR